MNKKAFQYASLLIIVSLVLAFAIYICNLQLFSSNPRISPLEVTFLEGIFLIIVGVIFFIGSGGLSRATQKTAMLAAAAKVITDDVVGPSEIFKRDAWKPKGYTQFGLTLILTGIILLIIYCISL